MDPQLKAQLKQIVTYAVSAATANAYGETTVATTPLGFSTATAYCRLETRVGSVEKFDGTFQRTRDPLLVLESINTPAVRGIGYVTVHTPALLANGQTLTLVDASGTTQRFEFRSSGSASSGNIPIPFTIAQVPFQTGAAILDSVATSPLLMSGTYTGAGTGTNASSLMFVQNTGGTAGNTAIVNSTPAAITDTDFAGGTDASATTPTFEHRWWLPGIGVSPAFARRAKYIEQNVDENGAHDHWELQF